MRPQLLNPAQLPAVFRKEFELCAVKPGETIILLTNLNTRRDYVLAATAAADDVGADIFEINLNRIADPSRVRSAKHATPERASSQSSSRQMSWRGCNRHPASRRPCCMPPSSGAMRRK